MTDDELRSMLRTWQAPRAPETLRKRVFRQRWRGFGWLLSGEIRVPVPVALAAILLFVMLIAYRTASPPTASLSDFEQVQSLQPRIVRTVHETR
jgi:hypothetical protein